MATKAATNWVRSQPKISPPHMQALSEVSRGLASRNIPKELERDLVGMGYVYRGLGGLVLTSEGEIYHALQK